MPTPSDEPLAVYTGSYESIRLGFTPEPPMPRDELRWRSANYPTELAYIHVFLNGEDAAKEVPSAYLLWTLDNLLAAIPILLQGGSETAKWVSDPWQFELHGDPAQNRVRLTLLWPGRQLRIIDQASVPLSDFAREVIRLSRAWEEYLLSLYDGLYAAEMQEPEKGKSYRLFKHYQGAAERALDHYTADWLQRYSQ